MKTAKRMSRGHRSRQEIMTSGKQNRKYSMTGLRFELLKTTVVARNKMKRKLISTNRMQHIPSLKTAEIPGSKVNPASLYNNTKSRGLKVQNLPSSFSIF